MTNIVFIDFLRFILNCLPILQFSLVITLVIDVLV